VVRQVREALPQRATSLPPAVSRNVVAERRDLSPSAARFDKTKPIARAATERSTARAAERRLAPRQLTAAELLLAGSTVAAAAARLNISPRTIFRWLRDPRFLAEVDRRADLAERFKRARRALHGAPPARADVAKCQEVSGNVTLRG
jgi:DNA-binding NarL/FixJ family response regulator